jgi:hypothetical protein
MKSWYDIDGMEEAWRARKARLAGDKVFDEETKRIETALNELLNMYPAVFDRFFREFSELSVRLRSEELERFLEESPAGARRILQDYIAYARRFRVWFIRRQGSFRIMVTGPWQTKFRAQLVDGLFREIDPEPPGVEVFENERYVDDDLPVPTEQLEQLLASGKAKFVQLDDTRGKSALHQIEDIAYDPDSITFILHRAAGIIYSVWSVKTCRLIPSGEMREKPSTHSSLSCMVERRRAGHGCWANGRKPLSFGNDRTGEI